ncbi:unnamed protein product [Acanthoscelides obtectus]|uniref:Anaphase-promoting complex subunit 4 WD40 domain-containing protein n=1 Tax=Acanthoscelides obtectus TaxID=200917 RepID=A0A9P0KGM9_ACAOB|nr:unnamed protein product [Acanthoscelides obtectus]CAK1656945.1 Protein NEDD1 [Acanthoscelides obtectus]
MWIPNQKFAVMFASSSSSLRIQAIDQDKIVPLSTLTLPTLSRQVKISQISWCYDNSYIAMVQEGAHPHIVNVKDKRNISLVHTIQVLRNVTALCFKNNTKRFIALGTSHGDVHIYDTKNRSLSKKIDRFDSTVKLLEFSLRDNILAISTETSLFIFTDQANGANTEFVKDMTLPACTIARFHPSINELLAFGTMDGQVTIKDMAKEEEITERRHCDKVTGIAFTTDKKIMVTAGSDNRIFMSNLATHAPVFKMIIHTGATSLDISPDNSMLAVGLEDGSVYLYDIHDPLKPLHVPNAHSGPVYRIAFERGPVVMDEIRANLEKGSETTLNASQMSETQVEQLYSRGDGEKCQQDSVEMRMMEERLRKEMIHMVKNHMTYLERKLMEHCAKFQDFMDSEFRKDGSRGGGCVTDDCKLRSTRRGWGLC